MRRREDPTSCEHPNECPNVCPRHSAVARGCGVSSSLPSVYECDKRAAAICRDMSIAGFAYDRAKSLELAERLKDVELTALAAADNAVGRGIKRGPSGGLGTKDLAAAFFGDLKAPIYFRSQLTGRPSLGIDAMRGYAACRDERLRALALAVLEWRRARKIRSTYIESVAVGSDGRVHPSWLNYGAISGRWACQGPNLMNLPNRVKDPTITWGKDAEGQKAYVSGGIRELYHAREGHVLVIFDMKQLEMRIAAYASGDEVMIRACEGGDLHDNNATVIFGELFTNADKPTRKGLRTLAKSAGFAVCYMAEAPTVYARIVADGVAVRLAQVEAMLRKLRVGFHGYFSWQDKRLLECVRTGYVETPILGRRRWVGHDPSPTECANHPIQGGAADLMNLRSHELVTHLRHSHPRARMVAQVHDSVVHEVPREEADEVAEVCKRVFEAPIDICSSGKRLTASFPVDLEITEHWH